MKRIRRFAPSPALVVAMIALFVALTGTAVATTSALITGKQIKNSSITGADVKNKSLTPRDFRGSVRGPRGLRGLPGPQGPQGATGPQGAVGPAGPLLDTLPEGRTLKGEWSILVNAGAASEIWGDTVSFQFPLAAAPAAHYIESGAATPAGCTGNRTNPGALPGHLCVFENETYNAQASPLICNWIANSCSGANRLGFTVGARAVAGGLMETNGTWAVTGAAAGAAAAVVEPSGHGTETPATAQ